MIGLFLFQGRNDLAAYLLSFPAAWMEITTAGWIDWTRYIPLQDNAFAFLLNIGIWHRYCRKERLCIGMQGQLIQLFALGQFRNTSKIHHCHSITDMLHDRKIMRDKQVRQA